MSSAAQEEAFKLGVLSSIRTSLYYMVSLPIVYYYKTKLGTVMEALAHMVVYYYP